MRKFTMALTVAALAASPILTAPLATAAQVDTSPYVQPVPMPVEPVQPLDCAGTTGNMGCGPGWFWRDGWRGWACYPC
jgi:hypothetical protein